MQSAFKSARKSIAERSIRVLVYPTPVTFAERRSVLQVLEQYGPVEFFKMTKDYHANFISLTKEATTATKLVACSPLTYHLPVPRMKTDVHMVDLIDEASSDLFNAVGNRPSVQEALATNDDAMARDGNPDSSEHRQFKLEIFPAPDYLHEFAMRRSVLSQPWPETYAKNESFIANTLKLSLPQTMQSRGLAHWLLDTASLAGKTSHKNERILLKSWLPSKMKV